MYNNEFRAVRDLVTALSFAFLEQKHDTDEVLLRHGQLSRSFSSQAFHRGNMADGYGDTPRYVQYLGSGNFMDGYLTHVRGVECVLRVEKDPRPIGSNAGARMQQFLELLAFAVLRKDPHTFRVVPRLIEYGLRGGAYYTLTEFVDGRQPSHNELVSDGILRDTSIIDLIKEVLARSHLKLTSLFRESNYRVVESGRNAQLVLFDLNDIQIAYTS